MSQIRTAIATLIRLPVPNSSRRIPSVKPGRSLPSATPATMHAATQSDR